MRWILIGLVVILFAGTVLAGCQITTLNGIPSPSATVVDAVDLAVITVTPTMTASPTATFTPPPPTLIPRQPPPTRPLSACQDGMELVLDLSLSPGLEASLPVLPPGIAIEKGLRVRNTGACTWDSAYLLAPGVDNPEWALASQPVPVVGEVKPGGLYDFWIELTTPLLVGSHTAQWTLQNSRGEAVGRPLAVGFETVALPTQTALPEVTLVASPLEILQGEDALISWSTIEAKAAYFYTFGQAWREHPVGVNGSVLVEPERTTTYELRAVMGDDSVEIRRITIEIVPFDDPKILIFKLAPSNVIDQGQCVDIYWEIKGRVNTVKLYRDGNFFVQSSEEVGSTWDCPENTGTHTYLLQVTGPGGTSEARRTLEVR